MEMLEWMNAHIRELTWRVNPFGPQPVHLPPACRVREDSTQVLPLDQLNDDELLRKNYKCSVRNKIKKAEKQNFKVVRASTWFDWQQYYALYAAALLRWGEKATSRYSLDFFRTVCDIANEHIILWLVTHRDRIIGGSLNLYQRRHCVEWHAAFDSEFFKFGVRNFLVHELVCDAMRRGYLVYDFNPSGGHEGTQAFKVSFGTQELASPVIRIQHPVPVARRCIGRVKRMLSRSDFKTPSVSE